MVAHTSAVLDRARRHRLLTVPGAVFHQLCSISLEAKHCRRARHDLHDADLTGLADRARIIGAFYERYCINKLGRHALLARPLLKYIQVQPSFDAMTAGKDETVCGRTEASCLFSLSACKPELQKSSEAAMM